VPGPGRDDDRPPGRLPGPWESAPEIPGPWDGRAGSWENVPSRFAGGPGWQRPGEDREFWRSPPGGRYSQPAEEEAAGGRLVRPYTVTGGRTQPRYHLQVEALVTATVYEPRDLSVLTPECQAILQFCRDWRSVAEVSAVLRLPLGVARVLIADMSADGLVRIHQREDAEGRPDLQLLERVLSGLRRI